MFDSGSPKQTDKVGGSQDYNLVSLAEGANLNSNHIIDPTSTTRSIVQCGWDNDRDQWLFMTSNSTGVGVISASSDFSTASNNVGFLDQTATFPVPSTVTAGMYSPITMSNSMDGWTFFGVLDTDTDVRFGIKPPTLGSATTITVSVVGLFPLIYPMMFIMITPPIFIVLSGQPEGQQECGLIMFYMTVWIR